MGRPMTRSTSNSDSSKRTPSAHPDHGGPALPPERIQQLLARVVALYERNLPEYAAAMASLETRGITDVGLYGRHRLGWSAGTLAALLPADGEIRAELTALGVFLDNDRERFENCVIFPVFDPAQPERIVTLCGFRAGKDGGSHVLLPVLPTGLWNLANCAGLNEIHLVGWPVDALALEMCGIRNVVSTQKTGELTDADVNALSACGIRRIILVSSSDGIARETTPKLLKSLSSFDCSVVRFPEGHTLNSCLQKGGPEALTSLLAGRRDWGRPPEPRQGDASPCISIPMGSTDVPRGESEPLKKGLVLVCGLRRYEVLGLEKRTRKLKATVRVSGGGKLHVDTLDLYSARARGQLCRDLCRVFEQDTGTVEADLGRLLEHCERHSTHSHSASNGEDSDPVPAVSDADRREAEAFGKSANLVDRILADYETCGLVGEGHNKLLCYLAAVSRKMPKPMAVLILSSSGAGKTALQDAALRFCPPEDVVKLTSLSGKALFYKEETSLRHKVLAIEEGQGAEEATYAIRNLISAGQLTTETTVRDSSTGKLTTQEHRVEGPCAVFQTTTDPDVDAETRSRFLVTHVDESAEQTRAILELQRRSRTLSGSGTDAAVSRVLARHRTFQRLLKPLAVVNPFAPFLCYGDDRLQGRRDQPKYLNIIDAVAFLRQMSKPVRKDPEGQEYIEVDAGDLSVAHELADEILGRSLDEVSYPARLLYRFLEALVAAAANNAGDCRSQGSVRFTRRDIMEFTGWSKMRVHRYLKELVDIEYVVAERGRAPFSYRLLAGGPHREAPGRRLPGIRTVEQVLKEYTPHSGNLMAGHVSRKEPVPGTGTTDAAKGEPLHPVTPGFHPGFTGVSPS